MSRFFYNEVQRLEELRWRQAWDSIRCSENLPDRGHWACLTIQCHGKYKRGCGWEDRISHGGHPWWGAEKAHLWVRATFLTERSPIAIFVSGGTVCKIEKNIWSSKLYLGGFKPSMHYSRIIFLFVSGKIEKRAPKTEWRCSWRCC